MCICVIILQVEEDGTVYDEVSVYQPGGGPKYDISNIILGSGSLCIIKRANLRDKQGSKAVAAKMLKGKLKVSKLRQ